MFGNIYTSAEDLIEWDWLKYAPYFDALAAQSLSDANVESWLADWTKVDNCLDEQYSRLYLATAVNTTDKAAQQRFNGFVDDSLPAG